jgi:hypothetical protein
MEEKLLVNFIKKNNPILTSLQGEQNRLGEIFSHLGEFLLWDVLKIYVHKYPNFLANFVF